MRHSPVPVTLLMGILAALVWAALLVNDSFPDRVVPYPVDAEAGAESHVTPGEADQHLRHAQARVIHNASWSFLMTLPQH